jgi:type II secretory pathway pseudopilin PulG
VRALLNRRLGPDESGLTLVELLVASAMGVVLLGAVGSMVVSAMRSQPEVSRRAQNVSSARWMMDRLTREIRNGMGVDEATASSVSLVTMVRREACGGAVQDDPNVSAIPCQVTYDCSSGTSCTRTEAMEGDLVGGTTATIFSGIQGADVFDFEPSPDDATYIGITLRIPNPSGPAALTISDGASLRNAILTH